MRRLLIRWIGNAGLPSTDLYFRNACGHRIASGPLAAWRGEPPIRQTGANCFTHGDAMLLVRRDRPSIMRMALNWPGRLAYVVDDDIAGAADSPDLPADYRRRLAAFDREFHQPLLARADLLAVPADPLAQRFAADPAIRANIRHIDPWWSEPLADQRHHAGLAAGTGDRASPLDIVHLGSASHRGALVAIAPLLAEILAGHPEVSFTYFAAGPVHPALDHHPRARRVKPMPWEGYRRWLPRQRFHLALYPLGMDRFDTARSSNKLFEHGIVGAAGLYPAGWSPARTLGDDGALFAPADADAWRDALADALARRGELAAITARAAAALARQSPLAAQRALWESFFGTVL